MLVVGLTGSIGMGKSTLAAHLRGLGMPVFDADAEVHRLYTGEAVPLIEAAFPGTTDNGAVNRQKLSAALARDPEGFKRLNAIVHPLVRESERDFLARAQEGGAELAVLEIPLLFETGGDALVDAVILASAAPDVQRRRVLERPGMTSEKLDLILARQLPDAQKRARAQFVVDTGKAVTESLADLDTILSQMTIRSAKAWAEHWA